MNFEVERLYRLLPDFIRFRDQLDPSRGRPLEGLMDVLQLQHDLLDNDIKGLYRNWFIETCDEWMVPYIGDLLDVRGLARSPFRGHSRRSLVANTVAYRRRKGTRAALVGAARDASGWPTCVRALSRSLGRTQSLSRLRPGEGGTLDLREPEHLELLGTAFDRAAYSVDISRPNLVGGDSAAGSWRRPRANLPNLGVYFWRLKPYPVERSLPRRCEPEECDRGLRFDPFGRDVQLFNQPDRAANASFESTEETLPVPLRALPLARELEARASGKESSTRYFSGRPVFEICVGGSERALEPREIEIRDLEKWNLEPRGASCAIVAVDPLRGRMAFFEAVPERVVVSYSYGCAGDVGGGPYDRRDSLTKYEDVDQVLIVDSRSEPRKVGEIRGSGQPHRSIAEALDELCLDDAPRRVLIRIQDSATYGIDKVVTFGLRPGQELRIEAADGERPCLVADFEVGVRGEGQRARLVVNGLWIDGSIEIANHVRLDIRHCMMKGGQPSVTARGRGAELNVSRSLLGSISMVDGEGKLRVEDSLIDGCGALAIAADGQGTGPNAKILRSTLLGGAQLAVLTRADSALITGPLRTARPWESRVRFSFAQPEVGGFDRAPVFSSTEPGQPGYGQLAVSCPEEFVHGGRHGSEMGVFHHLCENERASELSEIINEYVPWGMETWMERAT